MNVETVPTVEIDERTKEELRPPCSMRGFNPFIAPAEWRCAFPAIWLVTFHCRVCAISARNFFCDQHRVFETNSACRCGSRGSFIIDLVEPL